VIAEAESTSVVWGMPGSVVEAGLADEVVALPDIAARIVALAARPPAT
jgi:two-component system chemotaxis response regulator CheB